MKSLLLSICLVLICGAASSETIFDGQEVIELKLSYDIKKLQVEKEELREVGLQGQVTTIEDGKVFPIEVMSRGGGSFECQQPQLKLKFNKKENKTSIFQQLDKVKLFTKGACLENKTDLEQDRGILANYLIYKMYEKVSAYSFKTRLFKIHYTDTSGTFPSYTQYGFFLEPEKFVEKRFGLTYIEPEELLLMGTTIPGLTNKDVLSKVNAFELFIANYDYGIPGFFSHIMNHSGTNDIYLMEKNSKLYRAASGEIIPFIYDFDFSRFAYSSPQCMFWFPFFFELEEGEETEDSVAVMPNGSCSVEHIQSVLVADYSKFKYAEDMSKHATELSSVMKSWKQENIEMINLLGPEYLMGLTNFTEAFKNFNASLPKSQ